MIDRDEDVRVRTVNGKTILGAMSKEGIDILTELASHPSISKLEFRGNLVIKRLSDGGVYLITADEGYLGVEYPRDDA